MSVANDFKKPNVNVLIFCSSRRDFELYGAGLGIASGKDAEHFPGDIETSSYRHDVFLPIPALRPCSEPPPALSP